MRTPRQAAVTSPTNGDGAGVEVPRGAGDGAATANGSGRDEVMESKQEPTTNALVMVERQGAAISRLPSWPAAFDASGLVAVRC